MEETITYRLQLESGREYNFPIRFDCDEQPSSDNPPTWAELDVEKCASCTLNAETHPYCPAALACRHVADQFGSETSIARVDVWVDTPERGYFKNVDLQTALRSLFGLIMATSGCPVLGRLRPLARFHLPFASMNETMVRTVGTYLVKQYLVAQHEGDGPDWELKGLAALYVELEQVNRQLMKRLRHASQEDANINAVQTFVSISFLANLGFSEMLKPVAPLIEQGF